MKEEGKGNNAKKFGMVIDLDKCTGCGSCMVACMSENNVPFKTDESNKLDSITWMRVYKLNNGKSFPEYRYLLPAATVHALRRCGRTRPFALCVGLSGNGNGLQHGNRNCQPDLYALFRMPLLHGRLPLSCPLF